MAQILEITVGASCSGKTTYAEGRAKLKNFVNLNRDDLRKSLYGTSLSDYKFSNQREDLITKTQIAAADAALSQGKSVIISDTNLDPNRWGVWKDMAAKHKVAFVPTYFPVPLKTLIDRNTKREFSVPEKVLRAHVERFEKNFPHAVDYWLPKPYSPAQEMILPYAYIVDVDGTLAHMNGKRGPFEWEKVGVDDPDWSVIYTIKHLQPKHKIIIMSGRDEVCRKATEEWLHSHGIVFDVLLMRKHEDNRPDTIIKDELFEEHIAGKYNVVAAFDDRDVVVDMWRKKGVKCFQVERGDF